MSRWLSIFLLAASAGVHAAPATPAEDELSRFLSDKSLLTRLESSL